MWIHVAWLVTVGQFCLRGGLREGLVLSGPRRIVREEGGSNFMDSAWPHHRAFAFLLSQSWNSTTQPQNMFDRVMNDMTGLWELKRNNRSGHWVFYRVPHGKPHLQKQTIQSNNCFHSHLVKHLERWQTQAQRGKVTCLRSHSQSTLQGLKSDTPQWVPFLLLREVCGDEGWVLVWISAQTVETLPMVG